MPTREEFRANLLELAELLAPPPPPPAPTPNWVNVSTNKLRSSDVLVPHGGTVARVPLVLDEPAKQTMVFKVSTKNGTAIQNSHFAKVDKWVAFQPGDRAMIIDIPIVGNMNAKNFRLETTHPQGWYGSAAPRFHNTYATIWGEGSATVPVPVVTEAGSVNLTPKPSGLSLRWQEDFPNFQCTDTGFLPDGAPCWRSRMGFGRMWDNGTLAAAVDPILHPGTTPWLVENGKFCLQSEHIPEGVTVDGVTRPWTMPMITTQRNYGSCKVGDYIEARMTMPLTDGSWPAFWLVGSNWPEIEFDIFEGFNAGGGSAAKTGTTFHWKYPSGSHGQYGIKLPHLSSVDFTQPQTWGLWWGPDFITTYLNDVPFMSVPNVWALTKTAYIKINIAVGAAGGNPNPANWPVKMPIDWVRIWN